MKKDTKDFILVFCSILSLLVVVFISVFLLNRPKQRGDHADTSVPLQSDSTDARNLPSVDPIPTLKATPTANPAPTPITRPLSERKPFSVPNLYGMTVDELRSIFPNITGGEPEMSGTAKNWRGWESVFFQFNAKGKLAQISFIPAEPMFRVEAERYVREDFGLQNDSANRVRTVNVAPIYGGGDAESIDIFFNIGWRD